MSKNSRLRSKELRAKKKRERKLAQKALWEARREAGVNQKSRTYRPEPPWPTFVGATHPYPKDLMMLVFGPSTEGNTYFVSWNWRTGEMRWV